MEGIPKIIHYCWFGEGKIPNQYQKYIKTWEKTFPEYRICKWDEKIFQWKIQICDGGSKIGENGFCE